jgi:hypothetical protein
LKKSLKLSFKMKKENGNDSDEINRIAKDIRLKKMNTDTLAQKITSKPLHELSTNVIKNTKK